MTKELTKKEIEKRMTEWRNIKKLYDIAKEHISKQDKIIKEQKEIIEFLTKNNDKHTKEITDLNLRVEELTTIVFGKKKKGRSHRFSTITKQKQERTKESYKRNIPTDNEITEIKHYKIKKCPDCRINLIKLETKIFYIEDIVLPKKIVIENKVETGFCKICKKYHSEIQIPNAKVIIGENVKNQITYQTTVLRLSYQQIQNDLLNSFNFKISSGEIDKVLRRKADFHRIDYERLKEIIRKEKVIHFDETGDKVRDGDGFKSFTWLMQGKGKPEVVFDKGKTRGGGNAIDLLKNSKAVGVTDDYGVYKNLFQNHQLCWAHLHRKLRDLAESNSLEGKSKQACHKVFLQEEKIYFKIRKLSDRNDLTQIEREIYVVKFTKQLKKLAKPTLYDPKKLLTYKQTLSKNIHKYLTCVRLPNIPADNNQAERSLRHIVLKRKNSFGHISARGAETSSILMSVFMTICNRIKGTNQTFFEAYAGFEV